MSRPLNFREIETFRAVMLTGTTTAAAAMLHISQPSVSRILTQMQLAAGIKLFDTKANKLQATPEAAILFKSVQSQFRGMRYIEQDIATLRKAGVGILRLGCTPALGLGVMSAIIARFIARHQEMRIHLETVNSHQLGEGLLHGWLDLAMVSGRLSVTQFDSRVVHRTRAVCIMQPSHPLAANTCLHVRQLTGQNLLMLKADDELSIAVNRLLHEHGVQTTTSVETNYSATLCSLAALGAGIGIVNAYVTDVFDSMLTVLPLEPACPVEIRIALPTRSAGSGLLDAFMEEITAHFRADRAACVS